MSFLMSFLKKRLYLGMFLILTIALWSLPTTALADSGGATVAVIGGGLTEIGDFSHAKGSAPLIGFDTQFIAYPLGIQVTDATGSGAGWNLQIQGTPLSDGVNGHPALIQGVLVPATVAGCAPGSTCTPPIPNNFVTLAQIGNLPNKFYSVAPNSGMGVINAQFFVVVNVPGNAFAGSYTTTLTLAVVSGP
jgi:hypothetical protein